MCNKQLRCFITRVEAREILLGGKSYCKCRCDFIDGEMTVYISNECGITLDAGDGIATYDYFLTEDRDRREKEKDKYPKYIAAVRVESCERITGTVKSRNAEITAEGYVSKSGRVKLKTVGQDNKPFVPVTCRFLNEDGEEFGLLACCFGEVAKAVDQLEKMEKVLVHARLKKNRRDDSLELSVTGLEFINKTEYSISSEEVK